MKKTVLIVLALLPSFVTAQVLPQELPLTRAAMTAHLMETVTYGGVHFSSPKILGGDTRLHVDGSVHEVLSEINNSKLRFNVVEPKEGMGIEQYAYLGGELGGLFRADSVGVVHKLSDGRWTVANKTLVFRLLPEVPLDLGVEGNVSIAYISEDGQRADLPFGVKRPGVIRVPVELLDRDGGMLRISVWDDSGNVQDTAGYSLSTGKQMMSGEASIKPYATIDGASYFTDEEFISGERIAFETVLDTGTQFNPLVVVHLTESREFSLEATLDDQAPVAYICRFFDREWCEGRLDGDGVFRTWTSGYNETTKLPAGTYYFIFKWGNKDFPGNTNSSFPFDRYRGKG